MISIYTHSNSLFSKEYWKAFLRKTLQKYIGPDAVRDSLLRGLQEHTAASELNPKKPTGEVVIVLSGVKALQEQIGRKQRGEITLLIAGPNIVISPHDAGGILQDPAIDWILVPSQWVGDVYKKLAPMTADHIVVWPAGVAEAPASTRAKHAVVYDKVGNRTLLEQAVVTAQHAGFTVQVLTYRGHTQEEYLVALRHAGVLVYLSPSESQGLAIQEAWARDVPTFVHYTGTVQNAAFIWHDATVNAPYLEKTCGSLYTTGTELELLLEQVGTFHPQKHCRAVLSDYASTAQILKLIEQIP